MATGQPLTVWDRSKIDFELMRRKLLEWQSDGEDGETTGRGEGERRQGEYIKVRGHGEAKWMAYRNAARGLVGKVVGGGVPASVRFRELAPPAGVEPTTYRLGGGRSIH